jgi:hypothetical protein
MALVAVVRSQRALEDGLQLILGVWLGQVLSTHGYQQGRHTRQTPNHPITEYAIGGPQAVLAKWGSDVRCIASASFSGSEPNRFLPTTCLHVAMGTNRAEQLVEAVDSPRGSWPGIQHDRSAGGSKLDA